MNSLIDDLTNTLEKQGDGTEILIDEKFENMELTKENFQEIKPNNKIRKIAFIDGGNVELLGAPNYSIQLNRTYFSIFRGRERFKPVTLQPRNEFLSYVVSKIINSGGKQHLIYETKLFPFDKKDFQSLPQEKHLAISSMDRTITTGNRRAEISRTMSIARRFAEWALAKRVLDSELSENDVIVMDGSLQEAFKHEQNYTTPLYDNAKKKGVTICGLSKTSLLFTNSGASLLGTVQKLSKEIKFGKWFYKIHTSTKDPRGIIFVIKLHQNSNHIYRFEILKEQFDKMNDEEFNGLLNSICANSTDLAMPGYPYGLIDADTFARVKFNEISYYRDLALVDISRNQKWKEILGNSITMHVHDDLNSVVG